MADENDNNDGGADEIQPGADLSAFVPEDFKGEDGAYDTAGFRARFDELVSQSQQSAEAREALPKSPDEYVWALSEDHQFPEGVDFTGLKTLDADGKEVDFDPKSMIDPESPDVKALQEIMHGLTQGELAPQAAMQKMAGLLVNREIAKMQEAVAQAEESLKSLGPDKGKARIETLKRSISARVPAAQASALMNDITSADGVRALEALVKESRVPPNSDPGGKPDHSNMKPFDRILAGLEQRSRR